ncbi:MAG: hypothetical protein PF447_13260 [Spirochaetaceae bacterium]|jgi:hypothetical protein|nr:hypothetical protein [Spirochaetaceae bacterium]
MVRIAKKTDPSKLEELKDKIHDQFYLKTAIQRIAIRLTDEIVHHNEVKSELK